MSPREGEGELNPQGANPQQSQQTEVVVDDSGVLPSYSNFCRVTATPEEVILDFGLNPQPFATGRQDVKAIQRIVMNYYTSKRLLTALGMTIQRYEGTFGPIELDVRRRARTAQTQQATGTPRGPPAPRGSSSSSGARRPPFLASAPPGPGTIGRGPWSRARASFPPFLVLPHPSPPALSSSPPADDSAGVFPSLVISEPDSDRFRVSKAVCTPIAPVDGMSPGICLIRESGCTDILRLPDFSASVQDGRV